MPFLGFAQNALVKWVSSDLQPTLIDNHISATPLSGAVHREYWALDAFYITNGNYSSSSSPDDTKYVQFTVSPKAGYQIKPSSFSFAVRKNGGSDIQKIQMKFSKNADFSNAQTILGETIVRSDYSSYNPSFPVNTVAFSGETIFVRLYVYNTNNDLHIQHNQSGGLGPIIEGTVSLFNAVKPVAVDDYEGTLKNTSLNIDILKNDDYVSSGALIAINTTKPTHGTVIINNVKDITYVPDANYVGYDSFYYTLINTVGESNTAKVEVQVIDGEEQVLVRWNNKLYNSTNYGPKVLGDKLVAKNEFMKVTQNVSGSSNPSFELTGLPTKNEFNGKLDPSRYLSLAVKLSDVHDIAYLKSLRLKFKSGAGTGNMTIKYSKNSDFSGSIFTVLDDFLYNSTWMTKEVLFPSSIVLYGNETLYFRIYTYNTWDAFFIDFIDKGDGGPAITGVASVYAEEPCIATVTWNGTEWSGEPTIDKKAILNASYNTAVSGSFEACSLDINAGNTVVGSDNYIILANGLSVKTGASMMVKSDGNFVQNNDEAENAGNITVERAITLKRLDYIYWASPVKNQNLKSFSPGTANNRFYTYNEGTNLFEEINPLTNSFGNSAEGNFESEAKGYAVRANNSYPAATATNPAPMQLFNAQFTGMPNNGKISFPLALKSAPTGSGNNLVGNPFPSNIDFNLLVKNNRDLIEGTAYLWTNVNPNPAMQGSNYPNGGYFNNYATLNKIGGIPATMGKSAVISNNPTQIIKIGQAFIVKAKKSGSLVFDNQIRSLDANSSFINKSATGSSPSPDRFWLHLTSPLGVVTTTLIGYAEDAQDSYDKDEDAKLLVVGDDALYTQVEDFKLGIQGRKGPLHSDDVVKLGMNHYETGNYTISLGQRDGIFEGQQAIYLKDKKNGIITDLNLGDYIFTGNEGAHTDRFEIVYRQETTLTTENSADHSVLIYRDSSDFVVKAQSKITDLEVYDLHGRLILKVQPQNSRFLIPSEKLGNGFYLIKVIQNDKVSVKKIIK